MAHEHKVPAKRDSVLPALAFLVAVGAIGCGGSSGIVLRGDFGGTTGPTGSGGLDAGIPADLAVPTGGPDFSVGGDVDLAQAPGDVDMAHAQGNVDMAHGGGRGVDLSAPPDLARQTGCGLKVNEIMTGTTEDKTEEYVELYNTCTHAIDATGWKVVYRSANNNGGNADTTLATVGSSIPAGGYRVFCGDYYYGTGVSTPAWCDVHMSNGLSSDGGAVGVRDDNGTLMDSVAYETLMVPNDFTEGASAMGAPQVASPGQALGRLPNGQDTNDNVSDFQWLSAPSPGAANQ